MKPPRFSRSAFFIMRRFVSPFASLLLLGLPLHAADAKASTVLSTARLAKPCGIVIGSEGKGVSPALAAHATGVRIPTVKVESLNAAVAAGILLYEARRQRDGDPA